MILKVEGKSLFVGDKKYEWEDFDFPETEQYFRNNIGKYDSACCITNEVFIKYAHAMQSMRMIIENINVEDIYIEEHADATLVACLLDVAKKKSKTIIGRLYVWLRCLFFLILSYLYLCIELMKKDKTEFDLSGCYGFYISRSKADIKMINVLKKKNVLGLFDCFDDKQSCYCYFNRFKRISLVTVALKMSFLELVSYYRYVFKLYGENCALDAVRHYAIRVVATCLYERALDSIASSYRWDMIYTADNLDRFAIIQENISQKHNISLVCIPHGIEYGFVLPHCFVGDKFYVLSQHSSNYLNDLYKTNKFIFDSKIVALMFEVPHEVVKIKKFVYFSEPREPYINVRIIKHILPLFKMANVDLYIKFHPKDRMEDYKGVVDELKQISDLNEAISNSICIARKSTVLIEALYNDSVSIAILDNNKDRQMFYQFPSLSDDRIITANSLEELAKLVKRLIGGELYRI